MTRIYYLQHVAFEGPAAIELWAHEHDHRFRGAHVYRGEPLPEPADFDALIIMGGPMSVHDTAEHPWLTDELRLIARSLELAKPLLGVCLGAQLMARAMGSRVYRAREKEIGWFPTRLRREARAHTLLSGAPETFTPLHWHGETFDLPTGAVHLAETDACPHQAFQLGRRALGLQFHLEVTPQSLRALVGACAHELAAGRYQQAPQEILEAAARSSSTHAILFDVLDRLTAS